MINSVEKIQYIAKYISAYEAQISLLNSRGLFDAAKMFELFAAEVAGLYMNCNFYNLNIDTYTYPCVDLISSDGKIWVQVSTAKETHRKIRDTLKKIVDSNDKEVKEIREVKFFLLYDVNLDKIEDFYSTNGEIKIFSKEEDLITSKHILEKAEQDIEFQSKLYELLVKTNSSFESEIKELEEAIENSRVMYEANVNCKIGNSYEIDRTELIEKIISENHKNIVIHGVAGIGKSVVCKKIIENCPEVLYARAERFVAENDINKVWGIKLRRMLELRKKTPLWIFIDALEFIADNSGKIELIGALYECASKYSEVRIITSCRTSDRAAFIALESRYKVQAYKVSALTDDELLLIANKFDIVKRMIEKATYGELIRYPFYVELIVSKEISINKISDENELREYIWDAIICDNNHAVKKIIEKITFTRAKNFSLGEYKDDYDDDIIERLISKNILGVFDRRVRLKHDIYEDICFEQHFNRLFKECRGSYDVFFEKIEKIGRCAYRRYQIWVTNKLFSQTNRAHFLQKLFLENVLEHWKLQTQIGIVKSEQCREFFEEFSSEISEIEEFIKILEVVNLYGFQLKKCSNRDSLFQIAFEPCGKGRECIINVLKNKELYKSKSIGEKDIIKICSDFLKSRILNEEAAQNAVFILQKMFEQCVLEVEESKYAKKLAEDILNPLYSSVKCDENWIKELWKKLYNYNEVENYKQKNQIIKIIEYTLQPQHVLLSKHLPNELCRLAEEYWKSRTGSSIENRIYGYDSNKENYSEYFGLNNMEYRNSMSLGQVQKESFLDYIFYYNFEYGLVWGSNFINSAMQKFIKAQPESVYWYNVQCYETKERRKYAGIQEMWQSNGEITALPMFLCEIIEALSRAIVRRIVICMEQKRDYNKFANRTKSYIMLNSNNIGLLSVIATVGKCFIQEMPGYALDLLTDIKLVELDFQVYGINRLHHKALWLTKNELILTTISKTKICELEARWLNIRMTEYMIYCLSYGGIAVRAEAEKIIKYLYEITPNNSENAKKHVLIQRMDIGKYKVECENHCQKILIPRYEGVAKELVDSYNKEFKLQNAIEQLSKEVDEKLSNEDVDLTSCLKLISQLLEEKKRLNPPSICDLPLVKIVMHTLKIETIKSEQRSFLCEIIIKGIESITEGDVFLFDARYSQEFFAQIDFGVQKDTENKFKRLLLKCIENQTGNGIIQNIAFGAKEYLGTNQTVARALFNTFLKLAEDEMNHQVFNANYLLKERKNENFVFAPNRNPKLKGVDSWIDREGKEKYKSKRNLLIKKYLLEEKSLEIKAFDINKFDLSTLCNGIDCGISLTNNWFNDIVKIILCEIIEIWVQKQEKREYNKIIEYSAIVELGELFRKRIFLNEKEQNCVMKILFEAMDFSKYRKEAIDFYLDIFGNLVLTYFDSHNDKEKRASCEKIIISLEKEINKIKINKVQQELYQILIMVPRGLSGGFDWRKLTAAYSAYDKAFLNKLFEKYGKYHLNEFVYTIYKLQYDKLLPDILIPINKVFKDVAQNEINAVNDNTRLILLAIISEAYVNHKSEIKEIEELTVAYEGVLLMLIELKYEKAAILLEEFRVH